MESHPDKSKGHDAGHGDHPVDLAKSVRTYLKVGATLIAFTVITWGVALIDFGSHAANYTIGLSIATFKVSLVALIFMHLNHERPLIYKFLLFTVIFAAAMMFLTVLAFLDPIKGRLGL